MTAIKQPTTEENIQQNLIKLRREKLEAGYPFMCFEEHLPIDQAIYEYPDGRFEVIQFTGVNVSTLFIRMASDSEIACIRKTNPAYGE